MQVRRKSKTAIRKQVYASNQQYILSQGGLTENQYNDLWLDAGKQFLAELYPSSDKRFAKYYHRFHNQRSFWKWWFKKWRGWEMNLLQEVEDCQVQLNSEVYRDNMLPIIYSQHTEDIFFNYIKQLEHVL